VKDREQPSATHWEPQVALLCNGNQKYVNKKMDETGKWVTDWEHKGTCIEDKVAILEYCRKVRVVVILANYLLIDTELSYFIRILQGLSGQGHNKHRGMDRTSSH
jgi:hypothetical protein